MTRERPLRRHDAGETVTALRRHGSAPGTTAHAATHTSTTATTGITAITGTATTTTTAQATTIPAVAVLTKRRALLRRERLQGPESRLEVLFYDRAADATKLTHQPQDLALIGNIFIHGDAHLGAEGRHLAAGLRRLQPQIIAIAVDLFDLRRGDAKLRLQHGGILMEEALRAAQGAAAAKTHTTTAHTHATETHPAMVTTHTLTSTPTASAAATPRTSLDGGGEEEGKDANSAKEQG